ncbi:MAG TPA: cytochrome C oxidase subunit IV family protein [Planctomycetaceae bacterium]|jgi:cytochrome c oxidase subunit 4|nr:cytochrome C oxidase subunit IV family protein [Planctomycetaceae bacterium]
MTDGHATGAHEHDSHAPHHVRYFAIFGALCFLTAVSVVCDLFHIEGKEFHGFNLVLAALVLSVATAKALFVMTYFMHLKFEGRWKFLLLSPTVILALGLPLALIPDVGAHYYTTDVPQNSAKVTERSHSQLETTSESPH